MSESLGETNVNVAWEKGADVTSCVSSIYHHDNDSLMQI